MNAQKEIDQRVHQEIKNYQTDIYQIHQAIQGLKTALNFLMDRQDKHIADLNSKHNALEISLQNHMVAVNSKVKESQMILDRYRADIADFAKQIASMSAYTADHYVKREAVDSLNERNVKQLDTLNRDLHVLVNRMNGDYAKLKEEINSANNELKRHFMEQMPCLEPVRQEFRDRLQEVYIDFNGLTKEIELCKKQLNYDEKRFENVYTLIERLKGKK